MADKDNFLAQFSDQIAKREIHAVDFLTIWSHYDQNKSGYLSNKELERFIKDLLHVRGQEASPETIRRCRHEIHESSLTNLKKDHKIELGEFARLLPVEKNFLRYFNIRNKVSREDFNKIFDHYDKDKSQKLGGAELLALLNDLTMKYGQKMGGKELEEYKVRALAAYDCSGDKKLSREELGMLISVSD